MHARTIEQRKAQIPPSVTLPERIMRLVRAKPLATMPVMSLELRVPLALVSIAVSKLLAEEKLERVSYREL